MILPKEKLAGLDQTFAATLTQIASKLDFTLTITEAVPANKDGSHVSDSEHFKGFAVDVRADNGYMRYLIVTKALECGIKRIGVYDKHVHLGASPIHPSPVIWSGVSH